MLLSSWFCNIYIWYQGTIAKMKKLIFRLSFINISTFKVICDLNCEMQWMWLWMHCLLYRLSFDETANNIYSRHKKFKTMKLFLNNEKNLLNATYYQTFCFAMLPQK